MPQLPCKSWERDSWLFSRDLRFFFACGPET
jgi:hypothetical protein